MFITIDGIDGAGKTTLANELANLLRSLNPISTKEPTDDSEWGVRLQQAASRERFDRQTEIEYFHKDRLFHIEQVIRPAIAQGRLVISDRYVDSTLAFQGETPEDAESLYRQFLPDILVPDVTLILSCPVKVGLHRVWNRKHMLTKYEDIETLERAKTIFESRQYRGGHYEIIDASKSKKHTLHQATEVLIRRCPGWKSMLSGTKKNFQADQFGPQIAAGG